MPGDHYAVALNRAGRKLLDQLLPDDDARLQQVLQGLESKGRILLVVDQPAPIGALPVAVAQAAGVRVGYLPGLSMRRIADLHPGESKTDARDAFIIVEAARTMPHTLRAVQVAEEEQAELSMLCGLVTTSLRSRRRSRTGSGVCSPRSTRPTGPRPAS